jgi:hypothetical protein
MRRWNTLLVFVNLVLAIFNALMGNIKAAILNLVVAFLILLVYVDTIDRKK